MMHKVPCCVANGFEGFSRQRLHGGTPRSHLRVTFLSIVGTINCSSISLKQIKNRSESQNMENGYPEYKLYITPMLNSLMASFGCGPQIKTSTTIAITTILVSKRRYQLVPMTWKMFARWLHFRIQWTRLCLLYQTVSILSRYMNIYKIIYENVDDEITRRILRLYHLSVP